MSDKPMTAERIGEAMCQACKFHSGTHNMCKKCQALFWASRTAELRRRITTYRHTAEECDHHEDTSLAPDLHDAASELERALDALAERDAEIERLRAIIDGPCQCPPCWAARVLEGKEPTP